MQPPSPPPKHVIEETYHKAMAQKIFNQFGEVIDQYEGIKIAVVLDAITITLISLCHRANIPEEAFLDINKRICETYNQILNSGFNEK